MRGPRALTVSDSLIDNCNAETRIDHQVDDDDKRASPNSIRTIDGFDSSSSSDGSSSESSQSNDKSSKKSLCTVCGKFSHDSKACPAKGSPYANLTPSALVGSAGHAKLVADKGPRS